MMGYLKETYFYVDYMKILIILICLILFGMSCSNERTALKLESRRESLNIVLSNNVFVKEAAAKGNSVYCYLLEVNEKNHLRFLNQNNWVLDSSLFEKHIVREDDCNYSNARFEFPEIVKFGNDSTQLNSWDVTVIAYDSFKTEFGVLEMYSLKRKDVVGNIDLLVIYDRKGNYIRTLGRGYQI
jgi:hypothetical protein